MLVLRKNCLMNIYLNKIRCAVVAMIAVKLDFRSPSNECNMFALRIQITLDIRIIQ